MIRRACGYEMDGENVTASGGVSVITGVALEVLALLSQLEKTRRRQKRTKAPDDQRIMPLQRILSMPSNEQNGTLKQ